MFALTRCLPIETASGFFGALGLVRVALEAVWAGHSKRRCGKPVNKLQRQQSECLVSCKLRSICMVSDEDILGIFVGTVTETLD